MSPGGSENTRMLLSTWGRGSHRVQSGHQLAIPATIRLIWLFLSLFLLNCTVKGFQYKYHQGSWQTSLGDESRVGCFQCNTMASRRHSAPRDPSGQGTIQAVGPLKTEDLQGHRSLDWRATVGLPSGCKADENLELLRPHLQTQLMSLFPFIVLAVLPLAYCIQSITRV